MRRGIYRQKAGWPVILSFVLLLLAGSPAAPAAGFGQIVENPAKPKAANAGRVVVPQEVLTISDEGTSAFYFKRPQGLTTAPSGSLFLLDEKQVLQFDKGGRFQYNLFKKGQGPGEMEYGGACLATERNVIIQARGPNKLLFFDHFGKYEREVPARNETRSIMTAVLFQEGNFYIHSWQFPRVKGDPDYVDVPHVFIALNEATGEMKTLSAFPTKSYVISSPSGGGGLLPISNLIAVPFRQKLIALAHTSEYLLKIYDPAADKVVREFRRTYERVKPEPLTEAQKKGGLIIDGKHYGPPELKYENDVENVLARDNEIWAVTSTKDKARGVLIDVFDGDGIYRDCFWLKLPEAGLKNIVSPGECALDGEYLWMVEWSEDETFSIKKYRIVI